MRRRKLMRRVRLAGRRLGRLAAMSLTARMKLGSYEVLAPLGAGGMGEVYRASALKLRREVAIKILPARLPSPYINASIPKLAPGQVLLCRCCLRTPTRLRSLMTRTSWSAQERGEFRLGRS